jgi:hypothetical protein
MEPEGSITCSKEPTTGPYPEPDESNLPTVSSRPILVLSFHLRLGFPSVPFPSDFPDFNFTCVNHVFQATKV